MSDQKIRALGRRAVEIVEDVGLFIILIATLIGGGQEIWHMAVQGRVNLADLLLLFIYLEVVAMVHAYWQAGHLPVRMPLYIAMVALARHLILDLSHLSEAKIFTVAAAIVLLGLGVLVVRYGHIRFPYETSSGQK